MKILANDIAIEKRLKLFVGNLPPHFYTEMQIGNFFSRYGHVSDCKVIMSSMDPQKPPFAFVQFRLAADVDTAILDGPMRFPSIPPMISFVLPREGYQGTFLDTLPEPTKVFVGGVLDNFSEEQLGDFFSQWGLVLLVDLAVDPRTKKSKGFAFVNFATKEAVMRLFGEEVVNFQGRKLDIRSSEGSRGKPIEMDERQELTRRAILRHFAKRHNMTAALRTMIQEQQQPPQIRATAPDPIQQHMINQHHMDQVVHEQEQREMMHYREMMQEFQPMPQPLILPLEQQIPPPGMPQIPPPFGDPLPPEPLRLPLLPLIEPPLVQAQAVLTEPPLQRPPMDRFEEPMYGAAFGSAPLERRPSSRGAYYRNSVEETRPRESREPNYFRGQEHDHRSPAMYRRDYERERERERTPPRDMPNRSPADYYRPQDSRADYFRKEDSRKTSYFRNAEDDIGLKQSYHRSDDDYRRGGRYKPY